LTKLSTMHIGLYFGSFNPIHVGHLIIASYTRSSTDMQQVWLVVSPQTPLKKVSSLLNEYHRLHLVKTAIEDDPYLRATDIEFHLPKPSYTVDTIAYLNEKYPQHQFSIIIGSDSLQNISKWKNYKALLKNNKFYVFQRPGFEIEEPEEGQIEIVKAPLLEISSTQIREMIKEKKPIRYMVPDVVAKEIEENNYYK
jgi:nicotinate-nucleotide adenylyltransferase